MKKNQIILFISLLIIILVFIAIFLSLMNDNQNDILLTEANRESNIILFTGETCPHCKDVENFIYDNDILDILDLSIKEVYYDSKNALLFEQRFAQCALQPRIYGVPLLWHNQNCILGPLEIINYLNSLSN